MSPPAVRQLIALRCNLAGEACADVMEDAGTMAKTVDRFLRSTVLLSFSACTPSLADYHGDVNSRHRKTLGAVFADPVSGTLEWSSIEGLLVAVGCRMVEESGSRVRFAFGEEIETFHRPHPAKEAKRYQVRAARAFLVRIGVTP